MSQNKVDQVAVADSRTNAASEDAFLKWIAAAAAISIIAGGAMVVGAASGRQIIGILGYLGVVAFIGALAIWVARRCPQPED